MTVQEILAFVRALPRGERLRVVERIVHEVAEEEASSAPLQQTAIWGDATDEEFETFTAAVSSARGSDILRGDDGPRAR